MQLTKATIGLLLGLGLLTGACGDDEKPRPAPEQPPPAAAKQQPAPPAAAQRPVAGGAEAQNVRNIVASAYPTASSTQLDCLTNAIVEELGHKRFARILAVQLQEALGGRAESARNAQDAADIEKVGGLVTGCGLPSPDRRS